MSQATKWSTLAELAAKLIAPITNAVLARLLVPEAFGVVATLTMVVSFAEIFTDAGFQKYLVQHQFEDDDDLNISTNVAFWTNLLFSLAMWAGIAVFATPITRMIDSPGCESAVIAMSLQIPLLAFSSIQMARYRRDFDFKKLFIARVSTAMVPLVVTVPLALIFKSYWALVVGTLARDVLNAVILSAKSRWKPRFCYSWNKLREMLSFSIWTIVENVTVWLTNYMGIFVVSNILNDYFLGLYKTTTATVNSYMQLITSSVLPVMFSALSRCREDEEAYRGVYFRFQRLVSMLVFPLGIGLFVFRDLATSILLGSQWMETADFVGMWSFTSALTIVFSTCNSEVFRSRGRPKLSVLVQLLHLAVLLPVLMIFAPKGYPALTVARSAVRLQLILVSQLVLWRTSGIHFGMIIRRVYPQLISAVVMGLAGAALRALSDNMVYQFAMVAVCAVIYAVCMCLFPDGRKQILDFAPVKKVMKRFVKKTA